HDSHTFYLDPRKLQESRAELLGRPGFTGIGVILTSRTDGAGRRWLFVEDVIPGAPAEAAGIRRFDRIVAVNGSALGNLTLPQASQLIPGPAGSTVVIAIQRA